MRKRGDIKTQKVTVYNALMLILFVVLGGSVLEEYFCLKCVLFVAFLFAKLRQMFSYRLYSDNIFSWHCDSLSTFLEA